MSEYEEPVDVPHFGCVVLMIVIGVLMLGFSVGLGVEAIW